MLFLCTLNFIPIPEVMCIPQYALYMLYAILLFDGGEDGGDDEKGKSLKRRSVQKREGEGGCEGGDVEERIILHINLLV